MENVTSRLREYMNKKAFAFIVICALFVGIFTYSVTASHSSPIIDWITSIWSGDSAINAEEWAEQRLEEGILMPIFENICEFLVSAVTTLTEWIIQEMYQTFNPSYQGLARILTGNEFAGDVPKTDTEFFGITVVNDVLNGAKVIGWSMATIILLFNIVLLIFGQAEQIKIGLARLIVNYIISFFLIAFAKTFILEVSDIFCKIWQGVVMSRGDVRLSAAQFQAISAYVMKTIGSLVTGTLPFTISFAVFVMWKFIKMFVKVFMSIIEHYLTMWILLLLFPAIVPTLMTPATSNIFKSYCRMIISQFVLMAVSLILLAGFINAFISGAWSAGVINYFCGLTYMKIILNLDTYMSKMGFDIATGVGNLGNSSRGAFMGLMQMARGVQMIKGGVANAGKSQMANAVEKNDFATYMEGARKVDANISVAAAQQDFAKEIAKKNTDPRGSYVFTSSEKGGSAIYQATHNASQTMPSTYVAQLQRAGINPNAISMVKSQGTGAGTNYAYFVGNKCVGTTMGGQFFRNTGDTTKYEGDGSHGFNFMGSSGMGSDTSNLISDSRLFSTVPNAQSFTGLTGLGSHSLSEDSQMSCVITGENTYKEVVISPLGSEGGFHTDVPKGWESRIVDNDYGEKVRVMFSSDKKFEVPEE